MTILLIFSTILLKTITFLVIRLKRLIFRKSRSMLLRDLYKTLSKIQGDFRLDLGGTMGLKLRL